MSQAPVIAMLLQGLEAFLYRCRISLTGCIHLAIISASLPLVCMQTIAGGERVWLLKQFINQNPNLNSETTILFRVIGKFCRVQIECTLLSYESFPALNQ